MSSPTGEEAHLNMIIEERTINANKETVTRRYSQGRFLSEGDYARVYEMTNLETGKVSAVKVIPKESIKKKEELMNEIKIHRSLHHPNIVGFEHFFEDDENVYILLELCSNQTTRELLKRRIRLTELEVQCYMLQIIAAINYLHAHRVIHRSLTLNNLYLSDQMEIKIGDFANAINLEFDGERKRLKCGPNYMAPEALNGRNGDSYEVDIWSLGIIFYTLLVGKTPFEERDIKTTYRRIMMNAFSFPDDVPMSEHSKNLITQILIADPSRRPSLEAILAHDFFNQGNSIPKLLPLSTLAFPPSAAYLNQFLPSSRDNISQPQPRDSVEERPDPRISSNLSGPEVWVKKWVDHSSDYGLGYLLSNGATGVCFNDSTKMILGPQGHLLNLIESNGYGGRDVVTQYNLADFPMELQTKVTLLQNLLSYFESEIKPETGLEFAEDTVYVEKWMKTQQAIIFCLSNKIVQANFQDLTEIILSYESQMVTYANELGERSTYPLSTALDCSNAEVSKRLRYAQDYSTPMLSAGSAENDDAQSPLSG
mmetsp:Transcript_19960/g.36943  ORF Transcript_19960/g.36943 Transcript_19960/m.36943 type:complete len:539 (-) Transcript_19960:32-1648(-)